MNETQQSNLKRQSGPDFEGLEIGAVSIKWVRSTANGTQHHEIVQHGGDPGKKVLEIFERHKADNRSQIVVTGETAKTLLDLPYRSETQCLEKALGFHGIKPDILLSLGGETFSVYPMKAGLIKNIFSTSKCAAGTGEFIAQQFQRMGMSLAQGLAAGHKYISYNAFTESSTTVGRYICSVENGLYDGLVNLGSFNCQPAMNSQAVIRPLANKSNIAYAALDCEGSWISTNQRRLLESIAVQARRRRKRKNEQTVGL